MLDPHFKALLDATRGAPGLETMAPEMARQMYRALRTPDEAGPPAEVATREIDVAGGAGPLKARLYTPPGAGARSGGLVFFHGGGFMIGDLDTHDGLCRRLASSSGQRVLSVDYRLAPENPFPAAHDDALAATRWAFDHAAEIGFDPERIAVGGDSAGGNLAAATAVAMKGDTRRRLAFQLLFYPGVGPDYETASMKALAEGYFLTKASIDFFTDALAAHLHPEAVRAAPIQSELSGLPPALVTTAGFDPLKDEGRAYYEKLKAAGVRAEHIEYPGMIHGFYTMGGISPAVGPAIDEAARALKAALAETVPA